MNPNQTHDLPLPQGDAAPSAHRRGAHRSRRVLLGALMLGLGAATLPLAAADSAHAAAPLTVDRNDDPDPATAMACTDAPADCSLRGAIIAANGAEGRGEILLPPTTYTLTRAGFGEDAGSTGDVDITDDLTITGAGARSTVVAGGPAPFDDRIFNLHPGTIAAITGITMTGGKLAGTDAGGAIRSYGDLTLDRVTVKDNTVSDRSTGGGVYSEGPFRLTNSTVSGNSADQYGGGLALYDSTATIVSSTISGNQAGQFAGGVLAVSAAVSIKNSTIASNRSGGLGGGIKSALSTVVLRGTIVAGNGVTNCESAQFDGLIHSQGNNLSGDDTCRFREPTDRQRVNPRLGALQNNGGPTDTRALLAGSPALDGGARSGCPDVDQRGVARPQGLRCDIGAFERRNHRPVARDDFYRLREDSTLRIIRPGVLRNDRDLDGDHLQASVVRNPGKGRLTLKANGSFAYRPPQNFNGAVRFRYRAHDAYGGFDAATVTIRVAARPR